MIEVGFIVSLFYSNLLMGEFDRDPSVRRGGGNRPVTRRALTEKL